MTAPDGPPIITPADQVARKPAPDGKGGKTPPGEAQVAQRAEARAAPDGGAGQTALAGAGGKTAPEATAIGESAGEGPGNTTPRAPGRRRTVLRNIVRLVVGGALRDWRRHLGANSTAIGSITLLLLLAGVVALGTVGLRGLAEQQVQSADVLHVYLRPGAPQTQVAQLRRRLGSDPDVTRVGYTSAAQALKEAEQRPGLGGIARAAGQNPFPASLDVTVKNLTEMSAVASLAEQSPAVDPTLPTSYDEGAYQRVLTGLVWIAIGGAAFLFLLAVIAIAVTQNSIRAAIYTRRDEVRVMELVGARRWMVRGPFLIEGGLTGLIGGFAAALVIAAAGGAAVRAAATQNQVLAPGVDQETVLITSLALLVAGLVLGAGGSMIALRRHLER